MLTNVSYVAAFTAGLFSFFSPCLLPLIPGYIMFLTGAYSSDAVRSKRKRALLQTLGFILGFTLVFMLLGVSASALGKLLIRHQAVLAKISGVVIIFFGLIMTGYLKIPALAKDHRRRRSGNPVSFVGAIGLGMAFAFGWTPCFGPILGAILAYTSFASQQLTHGIILLLVYSVGMAVPFLLTAYFIDFFERRVVSFDKYAKWLKPVAGFSMVAIGLLIFSGNMQALTNKLYTLFGL